MLTCHLTNQFASQLSLLYVNVYSIPIQHVSAIQINEWHHWLSGVDLMYMHDDSENMEDSFTIELTDGKHRLKRQVMVKVLPVNDEEPRVIRLDFHLPASLIVT